jgi:uncharacterized protein (DUF58 family)
LLLPAHVSARTPIPARIRIRNLKRLTPSFSIELAGRKDVQSGLPSIMKAPVYFPLVPAHEAVEAPIQVNFPRRGRHVDNVFVISTRFPFGFLRRTTAVELRRDTLVYPALEPSPEAETLLSEAEGGLLALSRGGGHDFHRIRSWEASDSARHVDWKTTARTGSLHVREYTREDHNAVEIAFDRRAQPGAAERFERAVERCAWLAWSLNERGLDIVFRSQGATIDLLASGEAWELLAWLAMVESLPSHSPVLDLTSSTPLCRIVVEVQ